MTFCSFRCRSTPGTPREAVVSGAIFTWCELQPGVPLAYETIAKAAGLSVDTLERLVPAMLKGSYRGLIVRTRRRRGAPVYRTTAKLRALLEGLALLESTSRHRNAQNEMVGSGDPARHTPSTSRSIFIDSKKVWRVRLSPGRRGSA